MRLPTLVSRALRRAAAKDHGQPRPSPFFSWAVFSWAAGGFSFILLKATFRMTPEAIETLRASTETWVGLAVTASLAFFAYTEGNVAFHKRFAPRFAERLNRLVLDRRVILLLLAPLTCAGAIPFDRHDLKRSARFLLGTSLLVLVIWAVDALPAVWRAVILAGVALALAMGASSILWHCWRSIRSMAFPPGRDPRP